MRSRVLVSIAALVVLLGAGALFARRLANPMPSAIHHAMELAAARPLIASGTIVCVDDFGIGGEGGKGMIVDRFFSSIRAEVVYSSYQKVWRVP